jgi:hypothetical protein
MKKNQMNVLSPLPLKLSFSPKFRVENVSCVADEVQPQSDATISSSNMKPVKWVKWYS